MTSSRVALFHLFKCKSSHVVPQSPHSTVEAQGGAEEMPCKGCGVGVWPPCTPGPGKSAFEEGNTISEMIYSILLGSSAKPLGLTYIHMYMYMYTLLCIKQITNENYCTAQGTLLRVLCGNLNGKAIQTGGAICICIDIDLYMYIHTCMCNRVTLCIAETSKTMQRNYTPVKIKQTENLSAFN